MMSTFSANKAFCEKQMIFPENCLTVKLLEICQKPLLFN